LAATLCPRGEQMGTREDLAREAGERNGGQVAQSGPAATAASGSSGGKLVFGQGLDVNGVVHLHDGVPHNHAQPVGGDFRMDEEG